MTRIPMAVIGCGHLGRIHARLMSQLELIELRGVVDPRPAARQAVAEQADTLAYASIEPLLDSICAAVIAAPTSLHATLALELIERGIHLLVEKPLASTVEECQTLVDAARAHDTILAVGHVERFNPAFQAIAPRFAQPIYLEAVRAGQFTPRSLDVGVILDLMIHDLELALAMIDSPVVSVSATGGSVLTAREDFAVAHVTFANGSIAHFRASRIAAAPDRHWMIYGAEEQAEIDWVTRRVRLVRRNDDVLNSKPPLDRWSGEQLAALSTNMAETLLPVTDVTLPNANPLQDELQDFALSITQHGSPRVTGEQGLRAVTLAEQIRHTISEQSPLVARPRLTPQRRAA